MLRPRCREACKVHKNAVLVIIILPSRELAQQVFQIAKKMFHYLHTSYSPHNEQTIVPDFSYQCFIGGRDIQHDVNEFKARGANLLMGTPGRLFELLISAKYADLFNFSAFELLILDEADKLLDFGFKAKLDAILKRLPKQRRTGLFSATQTR